MALFLESYKQELFLTQCSSTCSATSRTRLMGRDPVLAFPDSLGLMTPEDSLSMAVLVISKQRVGATPSIQDKCYCRVYVVCIALLLGFKLLPRYPLMLVIPPGALQFLCLQDIYEPCCTLVCRYQPFVARHVRPDPACRLERSFFQ